MGVCYLVEGVLEDIVRVQAVPDLRLGVWGSGYGLLGLGCRVEGKPWARSKYGCRNEGMGSGFRVWSRGCRVWGVAFRVWVQGLGSGV